MAKEQAIEQEGIVKAAKGNGNFDIELPNGHIVKASIGGKMRTHYIRIYPGDRVKVEISTYDLSRGRITYRYR